METTSEALKLIQTTAVDANKITVDPQYGSEDQAIIAKTPNVEYEVVTFEPKARDHTLDTVKDAIAFANRCQAGDHGEPGRPVVWVSSGGIKVVKDDYRRLDCAMMHFSFTPQLKALNEFAGRSMTQTELYRFLRVNLHGAFKDDDLLAKIKSVKWNSTTSGGIDHGKESMDREDLASAGNAQTFPEVITPTVRIFGNKHLALTRPIPCAFEVFASERRFAVTPMPQEIPDAIDWAVNEVAEEIRNGVTNIPVYMGQG